MALVNHAKREINAKIVYYGAEGSGKQALLTYIHERIKPSLRGELTSMKTGDDSLLFFDFSPFEKPVFGGYRLRFHLYTLPGRVDNPAAWRMTLKGADGVVAVVNDVPGQDAGNRESIAQLKDYLSSYGLGLSDIPCLLQFNRNDSSGTVSEESRAKDLGLSGIMASSSDTVTGRGVLEAFSRLSREIMNRIDADRINWPFDAPEPGSCAPAPADQPTTAISGPDDGSVAGLPAAAAAADPGAGTCVAAGGGWQVSLEQAGVQCDKGVVTLPLMVNCNDAVCRLTVTLSLDQLTGTGQGE